MPSSSLASILVFIALLTGCAAPQIKVADSNLHKGNSSVLYFERKSQFINGGIDYQIYLNDQYIGTLKDGGNLERRVESGNILLLFKPIEFGFIPNFGKEELRLRTEPGYDYKILLGFNLDSINTFGGIVSTGKTASFSVKKIPITE